MSFGAYLLGVGVFAAAVGGASAVAAVFVRRRRDDLHGAERVLAYGIVGTAALLASYFIPAVLGGLNRWTPAVAAVCLALVARSSLRSRVGPGAPAGARERRSAAPVARETWAERIVGGLALLSVAAAAVAFGAEHLTRAVGDGDQLQFHLPVVARWIQTGSIWGVHDYLPYYGVGNYPQSGEVLSLAAISPWRFDAFERFVEIPYFAFAGVAVYALALRLRARRPAAAVAAALFVSIPSVIEPSVAAALPDGLFVAGFAAGLVFLVRSDHALAGLAFGLAFGAKWYGVSSVALVVCVWAVTMLVARVPRRELVRAGGVLVGVVLVTGGFWMLRNVVESGSPFFPAGWWPLGVHSDNDFVRAIGHGPVDFTVAHYAFDGHVWRVYLLPILYRAFRLPGILLLVTLPATAAFVVVDWRRGRLQKPVVLALLGAVLLALLYTVTPASAQGAEGTPLNALPNARYLVPAAVPAAALAAWVITRLGRWGLAAAMLGLVAVLDAPHYALGFGWGALVLAFVGLLASIALVLGVARAPRRAAVGAVAAVVVGVVVGGQLVQARYSRHRFGNADPAVTWILRNARPESRVGLTGYWAWDAKPVYPSFGPRLRNHVEYLGVRRSSRLKRYSTRGAFDRALRAFGPVAVVVGLGQPPVPHAKRDHVVERDWIREAGYVLVTRSPVLELYRPPGRPPVSRVAARGRGERG